MLAPMYTLSLAPRALETYCLHSLGEALVQPRPASRWLPLVQHIAIQRVHEFPSGARAAVRKLLTSRRTDHSMLAGHSFAEVFKVLLIPAQGGGGDSRREHVPGNACSLHRSLLLRAQARDLGFNHSTQAFRHSGVD